MNKKSIAIYWLAVFFIGTCLTARFSFIQDKPHIFIPIMAVGSILAILTSSKDETYIRNSLSLIKSDHTPIYDYIRCIAVVLVIVIHTINWDLAAATDMNGTCVYAALDHLRYWSFVCNSLFVMLSGALLLGKNEPAITFYRRRLTKIAIPLIVYYVWYLWEYDEFKTMTFGRLKNLILSQDHVPHFWLINYLLLVYISMPPVRAFLRKLSYNALTILIAFTAAASVFLGATNSLSHPLVKIMGWILVSIMGYWCSRNETRKLDYPLIFAGILATIYLFTMDTASANSEGILNNLSILRLLAASGIFALLFKIKGLLSAGYPIRLISRYGYGIMLIHMWVLYFVSRKIVITSSLEYHGIGLIISLVATLTISLIFTYFIDNLAVNIFNFKFTKKGD